MKPKGKGILDTFYIKVQSDIIKHYINHLEPPIVVPWTNNSYFITINRQAFYIIPSDLYCLKSEFIKPCEKVFYTQKQTVSEIYLSKLYEINLTGNVTRYEYSKDSAIELYVPSDNINAGLLKILESNLTLFPKQIKYCITNESNSPIFIVSSLGTLLGGVTPLSSAK